MKSNENETKLAHDLIVSLLVVETKSANAFSVFRHCQKWGTILNFTNWMKQLSNWMFNFFMIITTNSIIVL
jgi:hypothetical protein